MSLESFWARLTGQEKQRHRTDRQKWLDLVSATADEKPPADADKVLVAAGKSVADLQAAVDRLKRRREAHAAVERGRAAAVEREDVHRRLAAVAAHCEEEILAAEAKLAAAVRPLEERQIELRHLETLGEEGLRVLKTTADPNDPAVQPVLADLNKKLAAATERLRTLNAQIGNVVWVRERNQAQLESVGGGDDDILRLSQGVQAGHAEEQKLRAEQAAVAEEVRGIQAQIETKLLEP
jgi:hypothetical protein